jgi:hypothetical protein
MPYMPPTVGRPAKLESHIPIFSVNLDGSEPFDPQLFDTQLHELAADDRDEEPDALSKVVKFLVVGSQMVVFPKGFYHLEAYSDLRASANGSADLHKGALACAGTITLDAKRTISGHSQGLNDKLSEDASNAFKKDSLQQALGAYFTIL